MLETLLANDLAGWRIVIQIDPSPVADDIAQIANSLLHAHDREVVVNPVHLGVRENPFRLLERVFHDGSALNLYVEEDLLLAPDATRLALWYEAHHRPDWLCLNLIAGGCASSGLLSNADYPSLLFKGMTFNSLGFAVRREEWQRLMAPKWMKERQDIVKYDGLPTGGWDWQIYALMLDDAHLRTIQPALARATHNGRLAGEFCPPWFHDLAFSGLPIYGGAPAVSEFHLLPSAELPSSVRRHVALWQEMSAALRALSRRQRGARGNFSAKFDRIRGRARRAVLAALRRSAQI
jgi:hypothetical protein